jgi:hypothetical protein
MVFSSRLLPRIVEKGRGDSFEKPDGLRIRTFNSLLESALDGISNRSNILTIHKEPSCVFGHGCFLAIQWEVSR